MEFGLRIGELCALKRDAIKDGRVYIKRAFSRNELRESTKTKDVRSFQITPYAQSIIDGQKHFNEFLFIHNGRPYNDEIMNRIWHKAERASGIHIKLYNALRHSLGCQLLDEGQDMSTVQQILGHRKADMTRRYAQRTAKKIGQILTLRRCSRDAVEERRKISNEIK